jgi:hypothetical protein
MGIPALRMNARTMCMRVSSYSKVDVVKQRHMVNSGVRGTKQERRPTSGSRLVVSNV